MSEEDSKSISSMVEFYINGCALLITSIFGIIGNVICIALLQFKSSRLNPTFSNLISWLAIIDSMFLIFVLLTFSLPSLSTEYKTWVFPTVLPSTLPLTSITLTASLYMVVATSVERYLQLYYPSYSNKGSFLGYVLPVVVFAAFYNTPKFFEFTTVYDNAVPRLKVTEFRSNTDYSIYVLGSNFIFMGVLPFTILIVLNVFISRKFQNYFISPEQYDSRTMGALLFTIVFVQIICHLPRTGLNFYEIYMALIVGEISLSAAWMVDISHLLLAVASASNVAIFAAQDLQFRAVLVSDIKKVVTRYRQRQSLSTGSPGHDIGEQSGLKRAETELLSSNVTDEEKAINQIC